MTYYNPRIYNYSNLLREDKIRVHVMMWTLDAIENMEAEYEPEPRSTIMEKMFAQKSPWFFDIEEAHQLASLNPSLLDKTQDL